MQPGASAGRVIQRNRSGGGGGGTSFFLDSSSSPRKRTSTSSSAAADDYSGNTQPMTTDESEASDINEFDAFPLSPAPKGGVVLSHHQDAFSPFEFSTTNFESPSTTNFFSSVEKPTRRSATTGIQDQKTRGELFGIDGNNDDDGFGFFPGFPENDTIPPPPRGGPPPFEEDDSSIKEGEEDYFSPTPLSRKHSSKSSSSSAVRHTTTTNHHHDVPSSTTTSRGRNAAASSSSSSSKNHESNTKHTSSKSNGRDRSRSRSKSRSRKVHRNTNSRKHKEEDEEVSPSKGTKKPQRSQSLGRKASTSAKLGSAGSRNKPTTLEHRPAREEIMDSNLRTHHQRGRSSKNVTEEECDRHRERSSSRKRRSHSESRRTSVSTKMKASSGQRRSSDCNALDFGKSSNHDRRHSHRTSTAVALDATETGGRDDILLSPGSRDTSSRRERRSVGRAHSDLAKTMKDGRRLSNRSSGIDHTSPADDGSDVLSPASKDSGSSSDRRSGRFMAPRRTSSLVAAGLTLPEDALESEPFTLSRTSSFKQTRGSARACRRSILKEDTFGSPRAATDSKRQSTRRLGSSTHVSSVAAAAAGVLASPTVSSKSPSGLLAKRRMGGSMHASTMANSAHASSFAAGGGLASPLLSSKSAANRRLGASTHASSLANSTHTSTLAAVATAAAAGGGGGGLLSPSYSRRPMLERTPPAPSHSDSSAMRRREFDPRLDGLLQKLRDPSARDLNVDDDDDDDDEEDDITAQGVPVSQRGVFTRIAPMRHKSFTEV